METPAARDGPTTPIIGSVPSVPSAGTGGRAPPAHSLDLAALGPAQRAAVLALPRPPRPAPRRAPRALVTPAAAGRNRGQPEPG